MFTANVSNIKIMYFLFVQAKEHFIISESALNHSALYRFVQVLYNYCKKKKI